MKKLFLIAAIAGVTLTSCTNDESTFTSVTEGRRIHFTSADYVHQTRTEHNTTQTFTNGNYQVWAWVNGTDGCHMNAVEVNASDNSYEGIYYWPDNALDFAAVSPANDPRIYVDRTNGATTITYTFDETNPNVTTTNLMHADFVTQSYAKNGASVALGFRHALAKLKVTVEQNEVATEDMPSGVSGYEVIVKSFSINNILCEGTYTVTNNTQNEMDQLWKPAITGTTTNWNIIENNSDLSIENNPYTTDYDYYVMPQNILEATKVNVVFDVITRYASGGERIKENIEKTITVNQIDGTNGFAIGYWFTNKSIHYTFKINPMSDLNAITFTAKEEVWGTNNGEGETEN